MDDLLLLVGNVAPDAPALGTRTSFDATLDADFTWSHSDDDGDAQAQRQIQVRRVSDLVVVVDSTSSTAAGLYTVAGGTLANDVDYEWRVRTADADGFGPYSSYQAFSTSSASVVAITNPAADGAVVNTASLNVTWTSSDPQTARRIVLNDGATDVVDTGKVAGSALSYLIDGLLQNGGSYTLTVYVWNDDDVSTAGTVRTFTVTYTPPAVPLLTVTARESYLEVAIDNPTPVGAEPAVSYNDLYRRNAGETDWTRIQTGIAADGSYDDRTAVHGQATEYLVTAWGSNGTPRNSAVEDGTLILQGAWIHDPSDPEGTEQHFAFSSGRSEQKTQPHALLQYAGRSGPVAQIGEGESIVVSASWELMRDSVDMAALDELRLRRGVVCYRDSREPVGRKVFGIMPDRGDDDSLWGSTASFEVKAVDYSEAV